MIFFRQCYWPDKPHIGTTRDGVIEEYDSFEHMILKTHQVWIDGDYAGEPCGNIVCLDTGVVHTNASKKYRLPEWTKDPTICAIKAEQFKKDRDDKKKK